MILVVCSSNMEFNDLKSIIVERRNIDESSFISNDVIYAKVGIGPEDSYIGMSELLKKYLVDKVVLVGTCGTMNKKHNKYDIVKPSIVSNYSLDTEVKVFDMNELNDEGNIHISSANYFVENNIEAKALADKGVDVVDMESYSIFKACLNNGTKIEIIKGISDEPYNHLKEEYDDIDWDSFQKDTKIIINSIYTGYLKDINKGIKVLY